MGWAMKTKKNVYIKILLQLQKSPEGEIDFKNIVVPGYTENETADHCGDLHWLGHAMFSSFPRTTKDGKVHERPFFITQSGREYLEKNYKPWWRAIIEFPDTPTGKGIGGWLKLIGAFVSGGVVWALISALTGKK